MRTTTLLAAIGVIALAACSSAPDEAAVPSATATPSVSASVSPTAEPITSVQLSESIDHVHGLVATGPGQLVAGTHSGAMAVAADGAVNAQGDQRDDLMGMTGVTGTNTLASSGHPGQGSKYPNPMGLLTSSDAGKNWSAVSLQGEIDFHALATSGKNVIGYGGGANLMISADGGKTWSEGAALQVLAVAYTGNQILATTQAGLQASTDGGKTFSKIPDSPTLALISAGTGQAVLGLDTNGAAWRSSDSGKTWVKVGEVGQVQAIAAYDNTVGYAIAENRLVVIK
jgi:photosystem II stability/assembly factor-like uncharacterized protein